MKRIKDKKRMIMIAIFVVIIFVIVFAFWMNNDQKNKSSKKNESETEETTEEKKDDSTTSSAGDNNNESHDSQQIKEQSSGLTFPYDINNSGLIINKMASFDGSYFEDGTNSTINGVSTISLKNNSNKDIEYALINIQQGSMLYQYKITDLPVKASIVVQEMNKKQFSQDSLTNITADIAYIDSFDTLEKEIGITENKDNSITIKNKTKKDIASLRIFYKYYMSDEKIYVGGITFNSQITHLKAGEEQTIRPSHFVKGSSKIMMVRKYD